MARHISPVRPFPNTSCGLKKRNLAIFFIVLLLFLAFGNQLLYGVLDHLLPATGDDLDYHEHDSVPQQIHVSLGSDTAHMEVLWATRIYSRSQLQYGMEEKSLTQKAKIKLDILSFANTRGCRYWHRAVLDKLKSDQIYHYRIISGKLKSPVYHFKTLKNGTDWSPRFLVYGDLLTASKSIPYILNEGKSGYDAVLHLGDYAYDLHSDNGRRGDIFLNTLQSLAAFVPYVGIVGDHESEGDHLHYRYRFSLPGVAWPIPEARMFYSLDIGPVHIIGYNPQVYFSNQDLVDEQYDWMLNDLRHAQKKRHKVPWIIVTGHRPLYCTHFYPDDCQFEDSVVRNGVEDLFYYYGVDLVLQGHEHMYERSWPLYKNEPTSQDYNQPKAPVYVITGSTANEHTTDKLPSDKHVNQWSAFLISERDKESVGRVNIINKTHLHYEQILTKDGSKLDEFTLVQNNHGPFGDLRNFKPVEMENINMLDLAAMQKTFSKAIRLNYLSSLFMFIVAGLLTVWMILRQIAICRRENHLNMLTNDNVLVKMA